MKQSGGNLLVDPGTQVVLFLPAEKPIGDVKPFDVFYQYLCCHLCQTHMCHISNSDYAMNILLVNSALTS